MHQYLLGFLYVRVIGVIGSPNAQPAELIIPMIDANWGQKSVFGVTSIASSRAKTTELAFFKGPFLDYGDYPGIYPQEVRQATDDDLDQLLQNCPCGAQANIAVWHSKVLAFPSLLDHEKRRITAAIEKLR